MGRSMPSLRRTLDRYLAAPMFGVTLLFLVLLSVVLHLAADEPLDDRVVYWAAWGLVAIYPLYVIEAAVHWIAGSPFRVQNLLFCVCPPLRLGARDHLTGRHIWLPVWGWSEAGRALSERLERKLNIPMIVIALAVLPLMITEHVLAERHAAHEKQLAAQHEHAEEAAAATPAKMPVSEELNLLLQLATGLVWVAFAIEFIVMVSVAEHKAKYCKTHWIDLAVIMVPFIAFLRAARIARLLRFQQLAKTARVYRLRGLMLRVYRGLILLDVVDRLLRGTPAVRLAKLKDQLAEKERDLADLRKEIATLEATLAPATVPLPTPPQSRAA